MSTPAICAVLPAWPIPGIEAIRQRWADRTDHFDRKSDFGFRSEEGQPPKLHPSAETERWDLSFGTDSRGEPTTITAYLRPCATYFDPDFAKAVGWEPRGEFWVTVWKLQEGLPARFERAAALVHEVAQKAGGVVVLNHRDAPPGRTHQTEIAAYVPASLFGQMLHEPDFAHRML